MEHQLLQRMNEISTGLVKTPGSPGDLNSILQHIAETARDAFVSDACVILAFNPITGRYISSEVMCNLHDKHEYLHEEPRPAGTTQEVLNDGMILIEDLTAKPRYHNRFTRHEGFRAFAGFALQTRHRKRPLGVIYLDFKEPREFSSADCESFRNFAVQASFLLQEAWLAHHYENVARIGQEINQDLATAEEIFKILERYIKSVLDDSHTLLLAISNPQTKTLDIHLRGEGYKIRVDRPLGGACQYIIETQEALFIRRWSEEKDQLTCEVINITETKEKESLIFVPLALRGEPLGVLSIQHALPEAYGQEDLFVLQLLANYISLALHNMRLYNSLNQLHETGQLLTQQLESDQALQANVDKIREATQADIVILYPYEASRQQFIFPPRIAGTLYASFPQGMGPRLPNDIASVAVQLVESVFAKESNTIYSSMNSDVRLREVNFQQREKIRSTAVVPLRVKNESVGVLFINFRQPQRFDATQKKLIDGLAHYAAIAIKNTQEYGSLILRRVHELEILQHIDRELNQSLDLESVLYTLLRLAQEHVPAEEASILLNIPGQSVLETAAAIGLHAEASKAQKLLLRENKGITRWVIEHKKPVRIENIRLDPFWRDLHLPVAEDIISELDVPLLDGEEVIGVLNFESNREAAFSQADQDFLVTLAGQAVLAIKNAQAFEREKRLVAEAQVLNEISKEITSQLDLDHTFNLILEKALELTHATAGNLMIYDAEKNDLWMAAERGVAADKRGQRQGLDQGVVGYVARDKQSVNVDLSQKPWSDIYLDLIPGTCFELAIPMQAGNKLVGVLNVESISSFTGNDEQLLKGLADLAVIALQNARTYEREKRLAEESQVLNQISREITSQLDIAHVFDVILEKALELSHSTLGSLHLFDHERHDLWMTADRGVAVDKKGIHQGLGEGIVGHVAKNKRLLNVLDVTEYPWNEVYLEFSPGARSELAVPMLAGNELRGVLNVESLAPGQFTESDERLLKGLADLAVVAQQNAERYQKAEREAQRFELLYQAGQELGKIGDLTQLEQAYDIVTQIAMRQSHSQVVIYRFDEMNAALFLHYASSRQAPLFDQIKVNEGLNGQAARERRIIVVHDIYHLPDGIVSVKQSDPNMRSFVIVPIMYKDQYYGNLGLRHTDAGHFRGADISFFEWLAQQLASTIYRLETAQARQEFEQRAVSAEEMSSIGQSAFEVTHRLGNDLGLVETYISDIRSELEQQGAMSDFVARKLNNIQQSVQVVLSFSRNIKEELANLGAKEEAAGEPTLIAPKVLLEEASLVLSLPANIQICLDVEDDVASVSAIRSLVADILRNLIDNAIQAMPNGGNITLRARNAGRTVALDVIDTGVGITQEKLTNIFGLFFSTKRSSGFGLWSARRNALRNHGDLRVESRVGQGTTFTLLLPRANERIA